MESDQVYVLAYDHALEASEQLIVQRDEVCDDILDGAGRSLLR